jgi:hypothetical protein
MDASAPRSYVVGMIRRRDDRKGLSDRQLPHWLTVSDMQGRVLDASSLEPGTDLYAVLARSMDRLAAEGWTIEDDGRYGSFFCNREGVRRFVHVRPTDPAVTDLYGPSTFDPCPTCGE